MQWQHCLSPWVYSSRNWPRARANMSFGGGWRRRSKSEPHSERRPSKLRTSRVWHASFVHDDLMVREVYLADRLPSCVGASRRRSLHKQGPKSCRVATNAWLESMSVVWFPASSETFE